MTEATALLMPGQGAQYPGMGTGLYRDLPAFRAIVDEVFDHMGRPGKELRSDWLPGKNTADPALPMAHVLRSQPLLFALDYALARLLTDAGLRPSAMLGHSVGELAAATLAGVIDLPGAVRFLMRRCSHLARGSEGGMVAVAASRAEVTPYLRPGVDVGAVNAPRQTVIAGPGPALAASADALRRADITCAPVFSLTPFHSRVLAPVVEVIRRVLTQTPMRPPAIPMISGYTARPLTDAEAVDPVYWARHDTDPVLFWPALEALLATSPRLLVECGPGQGLTILARRHHDVRSGRCQVLTLLGPPAAGPDAEAGHLTEAVARLGLTRETLTRETLSRDAVERGFSAVRQAR